MNIASDRDAKRSKMDGTVTPPAKGYGSMTPSGQGTVGAKRLVCDENAMNSYSARLQHDETTVFYFETVCIYINWLCGDIVLCSEFYTWCFAMNYNIIIICVERGVLLHT